MGNCFSQCFSSNSSRNNNSSEFEDATFQNNSLIFRILKTHKSQSRFLSRFWIRKEQLYAKLGRSRAPSSNIHLQCLDARSLMMMARNGDFAYRQDLNSESCTSLSLDLEWEHEYNTNAEKWLPQKSYDDISVGTASINSEFSNKSSKNRRNLIKRVDHNLKVHTAAISSQNIFDDGNLSHHSGRSTPDLEWWDQHQDHLKSEVDSIDLETKELLNEIELLKNQVLSETGVGLSVNATYDES